MAEYTFKDVIIDPEDPRVEIGMKYYRADFPKRVLHIANNDEDYFGTLESIDTESPETPFVVKTGSTYSPWACLIRKKEPSYAERQAKWIADNGIKVGDYVRVVRKADSHEDGWNNGWVDNMTYWVGKVFKVNYFNDTAGIQLLDNCGADCGAVASFPYFVLEKVKPEYKPYDFGDPDLRASLLGKAVKKKKNELIGPALVVGFSQLDGGMWMANAGGVEAVNTVALLHDWVFLDGTPCGKLVKEEEE